MTAPKEWLSRAKSNLVRAREDIRLTGVFLEDLCFDAQQAAEKAIKGVLIHFGVTFPYVHDLGVLLDLIEGEGQPIPESVKEAGRLTRFAIVTRYPGLAEPVTREEYEKAVTIAEAVISWAEKTITDKR